MKSFFKRQWPLIGTGVLLILAAFYLMKSGKGIVQEPIIKEVVSEERIKLEDIHYTHEDPEKEMKWILDAKKVNFSADRNSIFFHDFKLTLQPKNKPWYKLTGKKGDYHKKSGVINLSGDLEGFSEDGYKITTEQMRINEKKGCLKTDKPVKISGPFFSVEGKGLFVDLKKEKAKILSDVTTIVKGRSLVL
ncbi:MAG TPA: LPS export ABC transporter periplasmic protein LptC [Desulfobacteraceae bacterium]|nr:LPS export ABC transporter periplasmic protein LptC [Desulfobacteraceae bacterium]